MRLIDADRLWDVMNKATMNHLVTNTLWNTLKSVVENAPTIDAVDVVRCKDCKFKNSETRCPLGELLDGDGFCSLGERRSE